LRDQREAVMSDERCPICGEAIRRTPWDADPVEHHPMTVRIIRGRRTVVFSEGADLLCKHCAKWADRLTGAAMDSMGRDVVGMYLSLGADR